MSKLEHGVIGNGRVLALIAPTSAIEWLCMPRFDSPSVFARILDAERGGTFRILMRGREVAGAQEYIRNTNVIRTELVSGEDRCEILDFAPRIPRGLVVDSPIEIVRIVRPIAGTPRICVDFDPRPDYARGEVRLTETGSGVIVEGDTGAFVLETNAPISYVLSKTEMLLTEPLVFRFRFGRELSRSTPAHALEELAETIAGWRAWAKTCALPLFAPELVLRAALCLKMHVFEDTGAIIAATTTSIPEALGTQRTWDYRYCWLRDAAFVVEALRRLSHLHEGERFLKFLSDVVSTSPLQPLYRIDGGSHVPETFLTHLSGYEGNGYVRIGNAASEQTQHDVMGELVLCIETVLADPRVVLDDAGRSLFPLVRRLVEQAIEAAPRPDTSIWEFRTIFRNYTFSRAMCWAAISRGAKIARRFEETELAEKWTAIAEKERAEVLARGFNSSLGFFTQALDGRNADASSLLLPVIGIIDARDPRFLSTLDAYAKVLVRDGMMLRYVNDDDFGATTSAFTVCSFWWAEALALAGRLDEAVALFKHLQSFANPLGLYSEDIDPKTGRLLGNFPQAYTHVGLVHAATTIGEMLEARDGRVRTWA